MKILNKLKYIINEYKFLIILISIIIILIILKNSPFFKLKINDKMTKLSDFELDKADYYDIENMPYIQYFDSMDDLLNKINTVDYDDISYKMKEHNKIKYNKVKKSWGKLLNDVFK